MDYQQAEKLAQATAHSAFSAQMTRPQTQATVDEWHILYGQCLAFAPEHDRVSFDVDYCWGGNSDCEQRASLREALRWAYAQEKYCDAWDAAMVNLGAETEADQNSICIMITFRFFKGDKLVGMSDGYGLHSMYPDMEWSDPIGADMVETA